VFGEKLRVGKRMTVAKRFVRKRKGANGTKKTTGNYARVKGGVAKSHINSTGGGWDSGKNSGTNKT